jgi:broad specificity phosphatase PhoE
MLPRLRVGLVRHGESWNNVYSAMGKESYRANRVADPFLTATGERQAAAVGAHFGDSAASALMQPLDRLFVSPHRRTMQTMAPIARETGLAPTVWTDIFEAGGIHTDGVGEGGLTRSEMTSEFPEYTLPDAEAVGDDGWYSTERRQRDLETVEETRARAATVAATLRARAANLLLLPAATSSTAAAVTTAGGIISREVLVVHHDFICALLDALVTPNATGALTQWTFYNCALTVVDIFADGSVRVLMTNSYTHLPPELVVIEDLGER